MGETAYYKATYVLTQSVVDSGGVSNQATVTANDPAGSAIDEQKSDNGTTTDDDNDGDAFNDPTTLIIPHRPALEVIKSASIDDVNADGKNNLNDIINYIITVENKGNVTLNNITLADTLTVDETNKMKLSTILKVQMVFRLQLMEQL